MSIKKIYFASGCYWGAEKYFSLIDGVVKTEVGFANGKTKEPLYPDVKKGDTGHAETTYVEYDDTKTTLEKLLVHHFNIIDPTTLNRQGDEDIGTQYRTGVYYLDDKEKPIIEAFIKSQAKNYKDPIVVEVKKLEYYYPADEYHQKYLDKNPEGYCHIGKEKFKEAKR